MPNNSKFQHMKNNQSRVPLEYYQKLYQETSPAEASARCNIPYDQSNCTFTVRLMGQDYKVTYPQFSILTKSGDEVTTSSIKILVIRFLVEGKYFDSTGPLLTYRDIPNGNLYYPNFQGRCLRRLAFKFGNRISEFEKTMEGLGAEKVDMGDTAYRFEFISNIFMYFILWSGDDEFPPSSQILFENNFPFAFSAEDIAVVGDVAIDTLIHKC